MAYFTRYFKAYFNVGAEAPPAGQPTGGGLPSHGGIKRAKDWLRRRLDEEFARAFHKKKKRRVIEALSLPEPRKTLRLNAKRANRPLDFEKLLKRQEQKKQVFSVIERRVEEDLLNLFEVERAKRRKKAKRLRDEEFLLLHI